MADKELLSGPEAAARFDADPDSIFVPLAELLAAFGLTFEELRQDLLAGRITATATRTERGWEDVGFTGSEVARWMVETGRDVAEDGLHDDRQTNIKYALN